MSWRQKLRTLWPLRHHTSQAESIAAVEAAERSHRRAIEDRCQATATRAEADAWAKQVRDHNAANHFDTWLRDVIQRNMR